MSLSAELASVWTLRYQTPSARALYLHIPFCEKRCLYCDFYSSVCTKHDDFMRRYVIGLQHQIEHAAWIGLLDEASTAYVGGGTPSLLGEWLGWLCQSIDRAIEISELTFEANPESLTEQTLDAALAAGATRVSVGVQTLSNHLLKQLGRIHTAQAAHRALKLVAQSGAKLSADLICGVPGQSAASWRHSVEAVLEAGVDHVSIYPLMIEDKTPLAQLVARGSYDEPDDDVAARRMQTAARLCEEAGFVRYEVASYATAQAQCAHNIAYWTGQSYLGLGSSAASMLTRPAYERLRCAAKKLPPMPETSVRARLVVKNTPQEIAADTGLDLLRCECEFLSYQEALCEDLMLAFRMVQGAPAALIRAVRSCVGTEACDTTLARLVGDGLVMCTHDDLYVPTQKGWLLGNLLYGSLWELAKA